MIERDTTISTVDTSTLAVDTSGIRQRFVDETRQKFANAGYALSIDEIDILVTKLPNSLYESLFGRLLQPMHGAEARPAPRTNEIYIEQAEQITTLEAELAAEREHPTSILQCAACQRLAVVRNAQLVERAEQAEAALAKFKSQLCDGCGFDARKEARRR